jgi:uncharacterized protein YndB with AHSA1/START domain
MTARLVRAPRAAVYRACTDPQAIARWRVPDDMTARVDSVDGATWRMSLHYPDGRADSFAATVVERVPDERIVERIRFDAADRAGEMTVTTRLRPADGGTEVTVLTETCRPQSRPRPTTKARARHWPASPRSWNAEFPKKFLT